MSAPPPAELRALLALLRAPGLGPNRLDRLLARAGGAAAALAAGPAAWRELGLGDAGLAALRQPDWAAVDATLDWAARDGGTILTRADTAYPRRLAECAAAPPVLFVVGAVALLDEPQIAIVGSRNPSRDGQETTRAFARHLASLGLVVTSGLALGVDGAAHRGALETGTTLAVLGTGPDRVYPASHRELAHEIARRGALVTEFPPGTGPRASHFPRRNRIISGLSLGTLVTEAAPRSGSLITARHALEQGREVFAIPGSIHNPLARGCHALIRDGAKLIDDVDQLIEELLPQLRGCAAARPLSAAPASGAGAVADDGFDAEHQCLLAALGHAPAAPDELIRRTGLAANAVASMLLLLEMQGHVSSHPGGRYSRRSN